MSDQPRPETGIPGANTALEDPRPTRGRRRSPQLVLACIAAACTLATWFGLLVVVGGLVTPLPLLAVLLAVVALTLAGCRPTLRKTERRTTVIVAVLTLLTAVPGAAAALVGITTYQLHPAASPQDCRVVVEEHHFFWTSGGEFHVLRGETGIARRVAEFVTDDGEVPFTNGTADLTWYGEEASVSGPLRHPRDEQIDVHC